MIDAAARAFADILSPPFRAVLVKSVGLTLALLAALWLALEVTLARAIDLPYAWLDTIASILSGLGLVVGLAFLAAPVTALVAGFFLDDIAEAVERRRYPGEPVGRALPLLRSAVTSLRFLGLVLLVNLLALPLVFLVGFGVIVFLVANAYLLGREYFGLAASRHHDERTVAALRARHSGRVFAAGLLIALLLAVPVANLLGPLFATALMVHVHKRIEAIERRAGRGAAS